MYHCGFICFVYLWGMLLFTVNVFTFWVFYIILFSKFNHQIEIFISISLAMSKNLIPKIHTQFKDFSESRKFIKIKVFQNNHSENTKNVFLNWNYYNSQSAHQLCIIIYYNQYWYIVI